MADFGAYIQGFSLKQAFFAKMRTIVFGIQNMPSKSLGIFIA
jgi:hypothetical protein